MISTENLGDRPDTMPRWFRANRAASEIIFKRFYKDQTPATLFHYTSAAALISIVKNNEFWLSDATFLNDKVEIEHGRQLAMQCLRSALSWDGETDVHSMMEEALSLFESKPNPKVYVLCLSLESDDLSQWRGYGQGSAPVAIEIKHGPLMFGYVSEGELQHVRYELEEQSWTFDQVLRAYWDAFAEDIRNPKPSPRPEPIPVQEERSICAKQLYHSLWHYIAACKDPAFRSEREVRYIYIAHDFSDTDRGWYPEHPAPSFREGGGKIIPYLSSKNLHFKNMNVLRPAPVLPIKSVRIGPVEDQTIVVRGIRELLNAYGHKSAEITSSIIPFRPR